MALNSRYSLPSVNYKGIVSCICLSVLLLILMTGESFANEVGTIKRIKGEVSIVNTSGERPAKKNDVINVADTLVSASKSEAFVRLNDKSTLILRESSRLVIADFQFNHKSSDKVETKLLTGALRAITGEIGKTNPSSVKYQVGTATVGIRGTDIDLAIIQEGGPERAGVYNYVNSGEVQISLDTGESLVVPKEHAGFAPSKPLPGEPRLQLLNDRPAFFRAGTFDVLMQQLLAPRIPMR